MPFLNSQTKIINKFLPTQMKICINEKYESIYKNIELILIDHFKGESILKKPTIRKDCRLSTLIKILFLIKPDDYICYQNSITVNSDTYLSKLSKAPIVINLKRINVNKCGLIGIYNNGNSCYMNAALQLYFAMNINKIMKNGHFRIFSNIQRAYEKYKSLNKKYAGKCARKNLKNSETNIRNITYNKINLHIADLLNDKINIVNGNYDLKDFRELFSDKYKLYEENDALEFLSDILYSQNELIDDNKNEIEKELTYEFFSLNFKVPNGIIGFIIYSTQIEPIYSNKN